jgi:hypothetical protein
VRFFFLTAKTREGAFSALPGDLDFIAGLGLHFSSRYRIFLLILRCWSGAAASAAAHAKEPLGPALHQNDLHNYGQNQNGADDGNGVIVHGPLPVYVLNLWRRDAAVALVTSSFLPEKSRQLP